MLFPVPGGPATRMREPLGNPPLICWSSPGIPVGTRVGITSDCMPGLLAPGFVQSIAYGSKEGLVRPAIVSSYSVLFLNGRVCLLALKDGNDDIIPSGVDG